LYSDININGDEKRLAKCERNIGSKIRENIRGSNENRKGWIPNRFISTTKKITDFIDNYRKQIT
jgi:hypothetical protein